MPNIPYRTEFDQEAERVAAEVRVRRGGRLLNLDRMLLYCPPLAEGWAYLMTRVRKGYRISPRERELAICAVAAMNGADYEFHHHVGPLIAAGGSQAQVDSLADVATAATNASLFDETERAVLSLALDSTSDVRIRPATMAAVNAAFPTPEEVFELLMIIASYNMVSRVLVGLEIEIEGREAAA
jgi:alkylhydroperoxidase family enzyme